MNVEIIAEIERDTSTMLSNWIEAKIRNKLALRSFCECGKLETFLIMQPNNPLHGIKLEQIINDLVAHYGWEYMGTIINIKCFNEDPSVKSSLKFLRRTPWARTKVERMYLNMLDKKR